jgi:hypothetical protein
VLAGPQWAATFAPSTGFPGQAKLVGLLRRRSSALETEHRKADRCPAWVATEPDGGEGIRSIAQDDMRLPIDICALSAQLSPAASVGNDPDLLHHALILMAEDVTVVHEFSDHGPRELHSQSYKSWRGWNIEAGLGRRAPLGERYIDSIEDRRPTIDPVALCHVAEM